MVKRRGTKEEEQGLENAILAEYLEELQQKHTAGSRPLKSPYEQKLPHTHIIATPVSFSARAYQESARGTRGRTDSRSPGRQQGRVRSRSHSRSRSRADLPPPSPSQDAWQGREDGARRGPEQDREPVVIDATVDRDSTPFLDPKSESYTEPERRAPSRTEDISGNEAIYSERLFSQRSSTSIEYEQQDDRRPRTGMRRRKKKLPLYLRQPDVLVVVAFRNGSRDDFCRVAAPSLPLLLERCTQSLHLPAAARRIFLPDGSEAFKGSQVPRDAEVYISMGEAFKDPLKMEKELQDLKATASWTVSGLVLPPDHPKKKTKPVLSKRFRELNERKKRRVLAFKNGFGNEATEVVVDLDDMQGFFCACTGKFNLNQTARRIFLWDGTEVHNLYELPEVDSIMQGSGGTPVLGPVWISKGEGNSPSGVETFLNDIIHDISGKLAMSKNYHQQLKSAEAGEKDKVQLKTILSMSEAELQEAIELVEKDIEKYDNANKKFRKMRNKVAEEAAIERDEGSRYTMKHIETIEAENRLVGKQGLKLIVYENGDFTDPATVFFNVAENARGVRNKDIVLERFLDQCSQNLHLASKNSRSRGLLARKVFNEKGEEVTDVYQLQNEQKLWLSYGEQWSDPFTYCMCAELDRVCRRKVNGQTYIVREDFTAHIFPGIEKLGLWDVVRGTPDDVETIEDREDDVEEPELSIGDNHFFMQCKKKPQLVVFAEPSIGIKVQPGDKMLWPQGTRCQSWLLDQQGNIYLKSLPHLALTMSEVPVKAKLKSGKVARGYYITLCQRNGDFFQRWTFKKDGLVYNMGNDAYALTYMGGCVENEDECPKNTASEAPKGLKTFVAACEVLGGKDEKFQRWAIKQQRFDILGQWKLSKVHNPEWNKHAYSWPLDDDGNWNEEFEWPMEGYFIPCAPPIQQKRKDIKLSSMLPTRLFVLQNGEREISDAVPIMGPDLTNMMKDKALDSKKKKKKGDEAGGAPGGGDSVQDEYLHCTDMTLLELEMRLFLGSCTGILNMRSAARRLFDSRGMEHFSLKDLERDELVYVTAGEGWSDPNVTKDEMRRRALLCKLADDVEKIRHFVELRDPTGLVVHIDGGLTSGASLVVMPEIKSKHRHGKKREEGDEPCSSSEEEEEDTMVKLTAHETACRRSDEQRRNQMKWPWEKLLNAGFDEDGNQVHSDEEREAAKQRAYKKKMSPRYNPKNLQRFGYEDGFIYCLSDPNLVLTVREGDSRIRDVVLEKKKQQNVNQLWVIRPNGFIQSKYRSDLVITVFLPKPSPTAMQTALSYPGSRLTLQPSRGTQFGRANQLFSFNPMNGVFHAFHASTVDKEITAANSVNVCTASVIHEEIDQVGYLAYLPTKEKSKMRGLHVCLACARALRGRYTLQKLGPGSVDFQCCFGQAKTLGLQDHASFRSLNGKADLSTNEAAFTLNHWESVIQSLRDELSVKSMNDKISGARTPRPFKLLAYRNGEGRLGKPEMVIGSSLDGLMDQCSFRLGLTRAVRTLYMEDGTPIVDLEDLTAWYMTHRNRARRRNREIQEGRMAPEVEAIKEQVTEEHQGEACFQDHQLGPRVILNEAEGYYEVGPQDKRCDIYMLSICTTHINKLKKMVDKEKLTDPTHQLCIVYKLFDVDIASDPFSNETDIDRRETSVRICCQFEVLKNFFAKNFSNLCFTLLPLLPTETGATQSGNQTEDGLSLGPPFGYCEVPLTGLIASDCEELVWPVGIKVIHAFRLPHVEEGMAGQKTKASLSVKLKLTREMSAKERETTRELEEQKEEESGEPEDQKEELEVEKEDDEEQEEEVEEIESQHDSHMTPEEEMSSLIIEVWASAGEPFVPLKSVYRDYRQMLRQRSLKAPVVNELDTERHVLRQMQGRRRGDMSPGEFRATLDTENPVVIQGRWEDTTTQERDKQENIDQLQKELDEIKDQHKTKTTMSSVDLSRDLYRQPVMKRVRVFPNGEEIKQAVYVWGENILQIMDNAAMRFNYQKTPKTLFSMDGTQVHDFEQIERDELLSLSAGEAFMKPKTVHQNVEIRANWGRARKMHGTKATDITILSRPNTLVGVDPFGPPGLTRRMDQSKTFENKRITVYENGKNPDSGISVWGNNLDELLRHATRRLKLRNPAKCLYTPEGKKISDFNEILRDDCLVASTSGKGLIKV